MKVRVHFSLPQCVQHVKPISPINHLIVLRIKGKDNVCTWAVSIMPPAALAPGKPTEYGVRWQLVPIWNFGVKHKTYKPRRYSNHYHSLFQPVAQSLHRLGYPGFIYLTLVENTNGLSLQLLFGNCYLVLLWFNQLLTKLILPYPHYTHKMTNLQCSQQQQKKRVILKR
jgi:hypothetical protein